MRLTPKVKEILSWYEGETPGVKTNMARLLERFIHPREKVDIRYDPWLQAAAHWLVRDKNPMNVNWAALDFASLVCLPSKPRCQDCTLRTRCSFFNQ